MDLLIKFVGVLGAILAGGHILWQMRREHRQEKTRVRVEPPKFVWVSEKASDAYLAPLQYVSRRKDLHVKVINDSNHQVRIDEVRLLKSNGDWFDASSVSIDLPKEVGPRDGAAINVRLSEANLAKKSVSQPIRVQVTSSTGLVFDSEPQPSEVRRVLSKLGRRTLAWLDELGEDTNLDTPPAHLPREGDHGEVRDRRQKGLVVPGGGQGAVGEGRLAARPEPPGEGPDIHRPRRGPR